MDEGMKAMAREFPNTESEETVDHYHAHGKGCEDKGHSLKKDHGEPEEIEGDQKNEHEEPVNNNGEEANDHGYPGMIRKVR